jgi:hypothetical protein
LHNSKAQYRLSDNKSLDPIGRNGAKHCVDNDAGAKGNLFDQSAIIAKDHLAGNPTEGVLLPWEVSGPPLPRINSFFKFNCKVPFSIFHTRARGPYSPK